MSDFLHLSGSQSLPVTISGLDGLPTRHGGSSLAEKSVRLVPDKGNDHAVEVEEEHDQVEPQLDERFLSSGVSIVSEGLRLRRLEVQG